MGNSKNTDMDQANVTVQTFISAAKYQSATLSVVASNFSFAKRNASAKVSLRGDLHDANHQQRSQLGRDIFDAAEAREKDLRLREDQVQGAARRSLH